ncbi:transcriptional regulator [Escherichia coli]|nr:transcriptional regulator [Escherichia coli]
MIGEHKPSIPARTMAALACIAQNDSQQLLDEIVQQEGLEYATEVVIARQFIARCYESDPLVVTLQYQDEDYGYGYRSETYNEFDLRLRKHLSGRGKLLAALRRQTHCRTTRNNQSSPPFYCADPPGKTRNSQ